ncbi:hypothetical protein DB313_02765 [Borrelia turcica IST7]|uniref:Membrane associated protein n=1 Tax=Borrelia turcica IST7 TaxID=1104446 RepID=A0A386PMT4_9SPIR|nr:hypothetical protein [Borrelia turcica]AYE36395.1 hypothetical protein DB313_02765 [Borrelia turcica IST7]
MNEQFYEIIFLLSFSIFLVINFFNFKREFSWEDYFIIFPGIFFILNLYLIEIKPLMLYVGALFLVFLTIIIIKNISTILFRRKRVNKQPNKFRRIIYSIFFKGILVIPSIVVLLIATTFSYLGLFTDYPEDEHSSYKIGFTRIKDYTNKLSVSVWYPTSLTLGLKSQNPFLSYTFNPFFINEMNYIPKYTNVYKDAFISNNQKLYNSVFIILPSHSHDSMFKSLVNRLVKKGNIVYLYSPKYQFPHTDDFIKNHDNSLLTDISNKTIKYLVEPIKIFNERADKTSEVTEIQNIIELIKSTQKLEFLDLKMNLNKLTLITIGNQANIANSIINENKEIKKYINIGGKPQTLNKIKTLQLLIKQDENELKETQIDSSSIKVINMTNVGEISDFIFSRRYLKSFNFFKDKKLMLPRFNFVIKEINKFIEERGF